jgi:hypothetical protein
MQGFVIAGKARQVFRLIELKVQREQAAKAIKRRNKKKLKPD